MSKKSSHSRNSRKKVNSHVAIGGVHDQAAMAASCAVDTVADREWFRNHPGAKERDRPASPQEIAALGLPPDTTVLVIRDSRGTLARAFGGPRPGIT